MLNMVIDVEVEVKGDVIEWGGIHPFGQDSQN
jgi:hypothetical protein